MPGQMMRQWQNILVEEIRRGGFSGRHSAGISGLWLQNPQNGQLDTETRQVIKAFQMHFRPQDFSGVPDVETEAIALALVEKYHTIST